MVQNNYKSIRNELMEVQNLILENQYLQYKYPNQKLDLEISLNSLKELESEMFEALKKEKLNQNREVFVLHLDGIMVQNGTMPMKEYGEILINSQKLITSLAEKPLSKNQNPSDSIQKNTEMDVFAHCSGSLKIMLISKQSKLDNNETETILNKSFKKLNKISKYDENMLEILEKENIGKRQVSDYKNFIASLSNMHLDMLIERPTSDENDEIICDIDSKKSYKIYKLLSEKQEPKENNKKVTGIIKALDLDQHRFKIESKSNNKFEITQCDFNKKDEKFMIDNFNKEVTLLLKNITNEFIDKNSKNSYELAEIIYTD